MGSGFHDRFGSVSVDYAAHRPGYPPALFEYLASLAPSRELAWDCATGSGQAAVGLAAHFHRVVATDQSPGQIAQAARLANVEYAVGAAERSSLPDSAVDLITVAQALHWFDVEAFYRECDRVLVPGGVLAVWSYGPLVVTGATIDRVVQTYYHDIVGPYWPPERALVDAGYGSIVLPYPELLPPEFRMEAWWSLDELLGYLGTWSSTSAYRDATGDDPRTLIDSALAQAWRDPDGKRQIRWPLTLCVCQKLGLTSAST